MKVIYVVDSLAKVGGEERVIIDKMNYLAEAGVNVTLVTYEQGEHPMVFPLDARVKHMDTNTRFFLLYHSSPFVRPFKYWQMQRRYQRRLQTIADEIQPDIICATTKTSLICHAIAHLRTTAKRIVESHHAKSATNLPASPKGTWIEALRSYWEMKTKCRSIRRFDMLVALTERDSAEWRPVARSVSVIPNPVTNFPPAFRSLDTLNMRIIAAGRLCYQKGFARLIEAFSLVAVQCEGWHLDIFGNGDEEEALRKQIKRLDMEHAIAIHPFSADIYREYMSSDFFVLSSRFEGWGLVLLEAMSCGLPCISFDCDYGPREIISDGENGFLIPEGDVSGLGKKIRWMCQHAERIPAMGTAARAAAQQYRKEKIMPKWIDLFDSLL